MLARLSGTHSILLPSSVYSRRTLIPCVVRSGSCTIMLVVASAGVEANVEEEGLHL